MIIQKLQNTIILQAVKNINVPIKSLLYKEDQWILAIF